MECALRSSLHLLQPFTSISPKHISPKSSLSSPQRKFTRRKNHLRPKILKTLTKPRPNAPIPIKSPPPDPLTPVESPPEKNPEFISGEEAEELEVQETQVSEVSESPIVSSGKNSALDLLLWLVLAFVFGTVYVYVSGSASFVEKSEKDESLEIGGDGEGKSKFRILLSGNGNGGIAIVDEAEMERKIEEIRVMAREARAKEKSRGSEHSDDDDEDDESFFSNAIAKQVENQLLTLPKSLKKTSEKLPAPLVDFLRRSGEKEEEGDKGRFGEKENNDALLFKKKHKFRDFPSKLSDKPNGFSGSLMHNEGDKGRRKRIQTPEQGKGVAQEKSSQSMLVEASNNNEPSTAVASDKENRSKRNLSSKREKVTEKKLAKKSGSANSEKETEFWWSSLPYFLVVQMHSDHDSEGPQGLFSIKSSSDDLSHLVVFEDHGDAANFCYILQSCYEDLEDFSTEILFLLNNESNEFVKSRLQNAIFVRKGQLKLYAGQPLSEVEMALRSLAAQS